MHNRAAFTYLVQKLALRGWSRFSELNLLMTLSSIPTLAEKTREQVKKMKAQYRCSQVDIVAHSMGGIVARYFVQALGGDGTVRKLITLGTPHEGTELSKFSLLPHLKELKPGSRLLMELNGSPIPTRTQGLSISAELDLLIKPKHHAFWKGVRNIHLKNVGHAGLLFSRRVFQIIVSNLSH